MNDELRRPALGRALSAFGALVIGALLVRAADEAPLWATVLGLVAAALWLAVTLLPQRAPRSTRTVLLAAVVLAGAPAGAPTHVTGLVPALVALLMLVAAARRSVVVSVVVPAAAAALIGLGALAGGGSAGVLVGCLAGLVLAVVVGISRGQAREQQVAAEQERARSAALAERARIAGDLHDVLAHSLGGLVLQLDAVDGLLGAGRVDDATARVRAARILAADGLDEARRAVDALRAPEEAADLAGAIGDLIAVHRSIGAEATLTVTGVPAPVPPEAAAAVRQAAQEVLTNARRHAPGRPTALTLDFTEHAVRLHASTAGATPSAAPGSGRGLTGLRDRIRGAGGDARWDLVDDRFELTASVPR